MVTRVDAAKAGRRVTHRRAVGGGAIGQAIQPADGQIDLRQRGLAAAHEIGDRNGGGVDMCASFARTRRDSGTGGGGLDIRLVNAAA